MSASTYSLSNAYEGERNRLAVMQRTYDPGTFRAFEACGIAPGWECLEVGGGAGSVATWLADRTGPEGRVVATDLDTRWLDELDRPNLLVRRHDVVADGIEDGPFDLVHARLLLEHLPERTAVAEKLAGALKPGGWLVVEDLDWVTAVCDRDWPEYEAVRAAVLAAMQSAGYDAACGRHLMRMLEGAGLAEVGIALGGEGNRQAGREAWRPLVGQFQERLVEAGLLTDAVVEGFLARLDGGDDWALFPPLMVTVRGRRLS